MNQLVNRQNLAYETINRGFDGLDFDRLEEYFTSGQIKFFYTISRYSNPLGLSYSASEKEKLAQLANQYNVYIVEDDYMETLAIVKISRFTTMTPKIRPSTSNPFHGSFSRFTSR